MAEATFEPTKPCAQCGRDYTPRKPKRGPASKRCDDCYPPAERARNLQEVNRSVSRRRGRRVPEDDRVCPDCGSVFQRLKAKSPYCDACGEAREAESTRRRSAEKWAAWRSANPKPRCRECGFDIPHCGHFRFYCSQSCQLKRNRRVNSATRRARIARQQPELFDPIEIFERDGWRCYLCDRATPKELRGTQSPSAPEMDHIIPLARGGLHTRANVACACHACNSAKSDRFEIDHAIAANRLKVRRRQCVPTERPSA